MSEDWMWDDQPGWEGHAWRGDPKNTFRVDAVCVRDGVVRTQGDVPDGIVREALRRARSIDVDALMDRVREISERKVSGLPTTGDLDELVELAKKEGYGECQADCEAYARREYRHGTSALGVASGISEGMQVGWAQREKTKS